MCFSRHHKSYQPLTSTQASPSENQTTKNCMAATATANQPMLSRQRWKLHHLSGPIKPSEIASTKKPGFRLEKRHFFVFFFGGVGKGKVVPLIFFFRKKNVEESRGWKKKRKAPWQHRLILLMVHMVVVSYLIIYKGFIYHPNSGNRLGISKSSQPGRYGIASSPTTNHTTGGFPPHQFQGWVDLINVMRLKGLALARLDRLDRHKDPLD